MIQPTGDIRVIGIMLERRRVATTDGFGIGAEPQEIAPRQSLGAIGKRATEEPWAHYKLHENQ